MRAINSTILTIIIALGLTVAGYTFAQTSPSSQAVTGTATPSPGQRGERAEQRGEQLEQRGQTLEERGRERRGERLERRRERLEQRGERREQRAEGREERRENASPAPTASPSISRSPLPVTSPAGQ
jgi:TolA-binding protein